MLKNIKILAEFLSLVSSRGMLNTLISQHFGTSLFSPSGISSDVSKEKSNLVVIIGSTEYVGHGGQLMHFN